ncbi:hypothetical protein FOXB_16202 [Fusarium oxysporum f. sp. conglutinans Fo5176]|uniref:PNPLA domain-containing protein n=1 Tax=Fusarium oxysporum (strain Fo5176) TaxID=660025 RepID=F9GC19_FUSOF|nr:hypothetical protein FOXB_16202 [Fusarium oxysporum f. sp. conglutinans Fo5176]
MARCNCSHWLWASTREIPSVHHSGRLQRLTSSFRPEISCPSLNVIFDSRQKNLVNNRRQYAGRLRLDVDTGAENEEPVLIASAAMPLRNSQRRFGCCSSESEIPLSREMSDTRSQGLLFSRLLYPFVDIFCFYSYGPSDLTKIARWIATWPSQNGPLWRPSLMVLLCEKHLLQPDAAAVAEHLFTSTITTLTTKPLDCYFTDSWFLPTTDSSSSALIQAGFREHLSVVRLRRRESGLLLSVEHTNTLFERAFESAGTLYYQPIDLIRSARRDIPVSTELTDHLVHFMSHITSPKDLISFASPIIASSLFCDHYLPDMHYLIVRIRPPTAGHSILCVDGGGVRGIIPPAILAQVQQQLDLPIPIQEFFTLAYGVSAVLAMFANGWSVERCGDEFQELAKVAFRPPSTVSVPGVNWIRAILSDSIYSEDDIEIALRSVFGETAFTETAYAQRIGAKIGIPAATIDHPSSLCLFTNYNSSNQERRGYRVLAEAENIKTWEVYFPAKYLAGLGTFQDAGVLANNLLTIALAEFAATHGKAQPDLVLNVGTGTSPNAPLKDEVSKFITDSWIVRLKRAYMSLMQGRRIWDDVTSADVHAGRNCGRYRLDLTVANPPAIDDAASMPVLLSMVYRDDILLGAVPEIACHLFATLFYFELTALPQKSGSNLCVKGSILCTRKGRDAALPKIAKKLLRSKVYVNGKSCRSIIETDEHGNIQQHLEFITGRSLLIELKEEGSLRAFPITNAKSPFCCTYGGPAVISSSGSMQGRVKSDPVRGITSSRAWKVLETAPPPFANDRVNASQDMVDA